MRQESFVTLAQKSFDDAYTVLLRPFGVKKWLRLFLIAFLAGSLYNCNANLRDGKRDEAPSATTAAATEAGTVKASAETAAPAAANPSKKPDSKTVIFFSVLMTALVLFFIVFFTWLSCRFKFVWLHAVVRNSAVISGPYEVFKKPAGSLFKAYLVIGGVLTLLVSALVFWGFLAATHAGLFAEGYKFTPDSIVHFIGPIAVSILIFIPVAVGLYLIDQLVLPIMYLRRLSFQEAWKEFRAIFGKKETAKFILVSLVLGFLSMIFTLALFIALLLAAALAALVVLGPFALILLVGFKAQAVFVIVAVVLAVPLLLCLGFFALGISLAPGLFFRAFSVRFVLSQQASGFPQSLEAYLAETPAEQSIPRKPVLPVIVAIAMFLIVILGLLAAIAIPNFIQARDTARARANQTNVVP